MDYAAMLQAVRETKRAFGRAIGSPAPAIVLLIDIDMGHRLACEVRGVDLITIDEIGGGPVEHPDGSAWWEFKVEGVMVRWPASRRATTSGYRWVP